MTSYTTPGMTVATEESFWSILCKNGGSSTIYIPRIQRDYAQGRTDESTTQIRERFLTDIFSALLSDDNILDINFIYGNIDTIDSESRFVPIDGQQRLTTLFLIYWYFALLSGRINEDEIKSTLLKFQYETRNVTGQFCKRITDDVRVNLTEYPDDKKLSEAIRDYYWFFTDFENDASIRAMLVMLDAIHEKTKEEMGAGKDFSGVFDRLISNDAPIKFLYLNIDDVGLTDSIYIKMNARGKALTHFENFKAQLRDYLSEDEKFAEEFLSNVNGKWSEFFWNPEYRKLVKDSENGKEIRESSFDSQMMKFFRFIIYSDYIVNVDEEVVRNSQRIVRDTLKSLVNEQDYVFTARLFKDGLRDVYDIHCHDCNVNKMTFVKISRLLNILSYRQSTTGDIVFADFSEMGKVYLDEKKAFLKLIGTSTERALTNEELVMLYAEYAFIIKYAESDFSFNKEKELANWLRVVSNLVNPTLNLQLDIYFGMIRAVNTIVESGNAETIYQYLSRLLRYNYRQSEFSIFFENQVIEESIKALLITHDSKWKSVIYDAENNFLNAQLSSLLEFSGIWDIYLSEIHDYETWHKSDIQFNADMLPLSDVDSSSEEFSKFNTYLLKFKMLFDRDGVKTELEEKSIFRRALLCYGGANSYLLPPGKSIQCFLDNTDRDYSFRRLLRDPNEGKRILLKELMDDLNTQDSIASQLEKIVRQKDFAEEERWKTYFVRYPEILDCLLCKDDTKRDPSGNWIFENSRRYIRKNSNDDILLLTKTQTNSTNRELYSYVLYLEANKAGVNVDYRADYTDGSEKYTQYTNQQGEVVRIVYKNRDVVGWVYIAKKVDDTEIIYYETMEQMLDFMKKTTR